MHLKLHQERISPTGNITSIGILNQLGRPNLEILAILVREAVQNSWDARLVGDKPIFFGIDGWRMDGAQRRHLIDSVFQEIPPVSGLPSISGLQQAEYINALVLYDRGTMGLGGPTRADEISPEQGVNNFVNFLRNVGQPSTRAFTGGTYGYGKAAFYRASEVRTICVYTRTHFRGQLESRFMVACLGDPYTVGKVNYTGRCWWGRSSDDNVDLVEPVLNEQADELASNLGMLLFKGDECGTAILVLQPHLGELTPLQATNQMAENILWYFWPKMMAQNTGYPALNVEVSWQGQQVHVPSPETYPPLRGFVEAMYRAKGGIPSSHDNLRHSVQTLNTVRPKQVLGELVIQEFNRSNRTAFDTGTREEMFAHLYHHTALMRQPELVVKYLPGPPLADMGKAYAGVFIVDPQVDKIFASAEPPTHDEWIPSSLEERHHRTFVNQALRQSEYAMSSFVNDASLLGHSDSTYHPAGSVAHRLGSLLFRNTNSLYSSGLNGPAQTKLAPQHTVTMESKKHNSPPLIPIRNTVLDSPKDRSSGALEVELSLGPDKDAFIPNSKQTGQNARARVFYASQRLIVTEEGTPAVKVDFKVEHALYSSGTKVRINTNILLDGNTRESAPPVGQAQPQIIYWSDINDRRYAGSDELFVPSQIVDVCSAVVSVPGNVMLRIELNTTVVGSND